MCFSATASFGAAVTLIPASIVCLKLANELEESYWAFAMLLLMFGLQQRLEGGVWAALLNLRLGVRFGVVLFRGSHILVRLLYDHSQCPRFMCHEYGARMSADLATQRRLALTG
jgi:hypothetical protein